MSSASTPISPERFREALADLPLSSLHGKAAEILNSIYHLELSNAQLKPFADEGDQDCADAVKENLEVVERMRDRLTMLKEEVESRGLPWAEDTTVNGKANRPVNGRSNGDASGPMTGDPSELNEGPRDSNDAPRRLTDEELARRIGEHMGDQDDEHGMHI